MNPVHSPCSFRCNVTVVICDEIFTRAFYKSKINYRDYKFGHNVDWFVSCHADEFGKAALNKSKDGVIEDLQKNIIIMKDLYLP